MHILRSLSPVLLCLPALCALDGLPASPAPPPPPPFEEPAPPEAQALDALRGITAAADGEEPDAAAIATLLGGSGSDQAILLLDRIGRERIYSARPALLDALKGSDPRVVAATLAAWARITPRTLEQSQAIWSTLGADDQQVRCAALDCVGVLNDMRPLQTVAAMLASPDQTTALAARRCLARISGGDIGTDPQGWLDLFAERRQRYETILDRLRAAASDGDDAEAMQAMAEVTGMSDIAIEAVELILPLVDDRVPAVAAAAIRALCLIRPDEYKPTDDGYVMSVATGASPAGGLSGVPREAVHDAGGSSGSTAETGDASQAERGGDGSPAHGGGFPWTVAAIVAIALGGMAWWARAQVQAHAAPSHRRADDAAKPKRGLTFTS